MLTDVYGKLPAPLQSLAATIRGYQLQALRYGPQTDRLVAEAAERETWDRERWARWQEERLARMLHHAATRVPYYRDQWSARRRRGDRSSWEVLRNWPILEKQVLRENAMAFVEEGCDVRRMCLSDTSGTTGTPLRVWHSREALVAWYAIFEARLRRWNGVSLRDRWAHVGGQRVTPGDRRTPPFWVWNGGMHQLYMSSYHIAPDAVESYLDAIRRHKIVYLFGYASAMHAMARVALERGLEAPPLRVAISNAEPFLAFQRDAIARVFRCPVRDSYGQAEIVCGASECHSGSMHLWPEVSVVELMRDEGEEPASSDHAGRLICTALLNPNMPLIRYDGGDRAALEKEDFRCACGRSLRVMRSLEGRTADLILTPDGSPVGGLDTIFHSGLPMREAQIVQESLHLIRINVVPAPGFGDEHREDLARGIRARLGPTVQTLVETVQSIPRTKAGKLRVQVSLLPDRGQVPTR